MQEYSEDLVSEIKDSIDIAEFIGEYVDLQKKGRDYIGKCPFHDERTGSFTVTPSKRTYYCFGCQKGGDIITFCREYHSMTYGQAIEYLASIAGINAEKTIVSDTVKYLKKAARRKKIEIPEKHMILDENVLQEFEHRKISKWIDEGIPQYIMDKYEILFDRQRNRIVYPVYDNDGNFINIKGRTLYDNPSVPKYMNYYPVGDLDYFQGFHRKKDLIKQQNEIVIFESIKSVMKLDSFGKFNSVSSETSQLNIFQVKTLIQLHCNVVIAYDSDVTIDKILEKDGIKMLKRFTNVEVIVDKNNLLGGVKAKNSPVDKGKEVWEKLYESRITI